MTLTRRTLLRTGTAAGLAGLTAPTLLGRAKATTPGTLVFGLSSYPPTLEPWKNAGTAAATVKLQIYRGLLGYDGEARLRPEIAETWEAEDSRTYRFDLRKNAVFHDGSPVTSADVKASFEAITADDSTAYLRVNLGIIESIETPDDHTVRVKLAEPSASFIFLVASFFAFIVKAETVADEMPMGCGPYTITNNERGTRIDLKAFPDFYKAGLPKSENLSFVAYKDENLRVAALEAGDVDIIEYVPWQAMDQVDANADLALDTTDGPFMYLLFNVKQGPLSDPKVRDAVGYAIKREDVMAAAFFGRGRALNGMPVPESSPYYNAAYANHWSYNPDRARELLAEAGYGDGFNATMLSTAQYGMHQDTAAVCQQYLQQVGINVELNLPDWATRVDLGNQGTFDMAVMGTAGQYNDPDALSNFVDGRLGDSFVRSFGFSDPELNALIDAGRAEIDQAKRKDVYDRWQARCLETVPLVGINWRSQGYATQTAVSGFQNIPGFLTFYSGSMIEEAEVL